MSSELNNTIGEESYALVEGDWKQFKIERIRPDHYSKVYSHIIHQFIREEPICILLGWSEDFGTELCKLVRIMLDQGLSFMATDKTSGEIAGIRVTFTSSITKLLDQVQLRELQTQTFWNGIDISDSVKTQILARFDAKEYAEFFIASTCPQYQNLGLATEMYKRSVKFLTVCGIRVVKCIFTSPTSRHLASKLGFEEVCRIYFKDLQDMDENLVFQHKFGSLTDEHYASAMVKGLNDK